MTLVEQFHSFIHPSYSDECKEALLSELNALIPELRKEYNSRPLSPSNTQIMLRVLEQDPYGKKGIILGMDPYPYNATGIPFEDPAFKQMSNKNIASNIARIYGIDKADIQACNLYNLSDSILLMNAALTVPSPTKGERSNSGAHFGLWHKFVKVMMTYILKCSNCRFILVFGKSQHLSDLADEVITASEVLTYKIISYHPCMATFFLREDSNPFQEVNALLRLLEEEEIKWYKAFPDFSQVDIPEQREIDTKSTFMHLCKTLVVKIGDLNSYEALLGDMELCIINKVIDNENTVLELSKIYNRSLAEFNLTVFNLLSTIAKPCKVNDIPSIQICGFIYSYGVVSVFLRDTNSYQTFSIDPLNFYFHERFGNRRVAGIFDLSVTDDDRIPINAYECLIELIYSKKVDYCIIEIITQLMRKLKPIDSDEQMVIIDEDKTPVTNRHVTLTGFGYLSDESGNTFSPKGMCRPCQLVRANNHIVMLRSLYESNNKLIEPDNRSNVDPRFSLLMYIEKDYDKVFSVVNDFDSTDDVLRHYGKDKLKKLSPFHLAVSSVGLLYPREFKYELEIEECVVYYPPLQSEIDALITEKTRLEGILEIAKSKSATRKKIANIDKSINDLCVAEEIIRQINRILKYLNYETSV